MPKHYIHKILTMPPHVTVRKVAEKIMRIASEVLLRRKDCKISTYAVEYPEGKLYSYFPKLGADHLLPYAETVSGVTKHFLDHRFDLLGSGWVQVKHGMRCRGLEEYQYEMGEPLDVDAEGKWLKGRINESNLSESQQIWRLINDIQFRTKNSKLKTDYLPIDWHLDFKSGYRWSEKTWYKDIKFGHKLGVDIKVPWELARMQHLPQMALCYGSLPENSEKRFLLCREVRNQILDFIATNPPRFGVNWFCSMDVGIRAANWLMTYDIFRASGVQFDNEFEAVFTKSIYEHGLQIITNLEWQDRIRGNHYLADIAGLIFIATYLPSTPETDLWLIFAVQELATEVEHQFYPDGGNFEGSTAYHRLSAEMVYYATALILGLPQKRLEKLKHYNCKALKTEWGKPKLKPAPLPFYNLPEGSKSKTKQSPFPEWYFERMELMAEFIMDITKPNNHIPQIGDNDSGRFFKLMPKYKYMTVKQAREMYANLRGYTELPDDSKYYMEDHLDCSHLVAAAYGLFKRNDFAEWLGGKEKTSKMTDSSVIQTLSSSTTIESQRFFQRQKENSCFFNIGTKEDLQKALSEIKSKPKEQVHITEFPAPKGGNLCQGITLRSYPDFGLYLFISNRLYLAIRCWPGLMPFHAAHMHSDQLSIELVIDGMEMVKDPGTYLYTPLPSERWRYRCEKSHFPFLHNHDSSADYLAQVFSSISIEPGRVKYFGTKNFIAEVVGKKTNYQLAVSLKDYGIIVHHVNLIPVSSKHKPKFSPGYGIKVN